MTCASCAKGIEGKNGDFAEVSNKFSRREAVVNVSNEVQRGLISGIFAWHGPSDDNPFGNP